MVTGWPFTPPFAFTHFVHAFRTAVAYTYPPGVAWDPVSLTIPPSAMVVPLAVDVPADALDAEPDEVDCVADALPDVVLDELPQAATAIADTPHSTVMMSGINARLMPHRDECKTLSS